MHYPCGENKGADQLRGYREADLRLCFRICKKPVFSRRGSYHKIHTLSVILETSVECMCFLHVLAVSRDNPSSEFLTGLDKNRACTFKENGKRL